MNGKKYSGLMSQNLKFSETSEEFTLEDLPKKKCLCLVPTFSGWSGRFE